MRLFYCLFHWRETLGTPGGGLLSLDCRVFASCDCCWCRRLPLQNPQAKFLFCLYLDDGPYGKTKDLSGPEQTMSSRRHSIPGTVSLHAPLHAELLCCVGVVCSWLFLVPTSKPYVYLPSTNLHPCGTRGLLTNHQRCGAESLSLIFLSQGSCSVHFICLIHKSHKLIWCSAGAETLATNKWKKKLKPPAKLKTRV